MIYGKDYWGDFSEEDFVLDKACLVCKVANRFHKTFWNSSPEYYARQSMDMGYNGVKLITDHPTILDNLRYLEYLSNKKEKNV